MFPSRGGRMRLHTLWSQVSCRCGNMCFLARPVIKYQHNLPMTRAPSTSLILTLHLRASPSSLSPSLSPSTLFSVPHSLYPFHPPRIQPHLILTLHSFHSHPHNPHPIHNGTQPSLTNLYTHTCYNTTKLYHHKTSKTILYELMQLSV